VRIDEWPKLLTNVLLLDLPALPLLLPLPLSAVLVLGSCLPAGKLGSWFYPALLIKLNHIYYICCKFN
jgi:hypothetical protein